MDGNDIHLLPLNGCKDSESSLSESEDDDSVEVISNTDDEENIVDMTKNLAMSSDDESDNDGFDNSFPLDDKTNRNFTRGAVNNIRASFNNTGDNGFTTGVVGNNLSSLNYACLESSLDLVSVDDSIEYFPSNVSAPSSSSHPSTVTTINAASSDDKIQKGSKRKRRQRSIEEKLEALATLKANQNKCRTAIQHGCTTAQLASK